MLNLPLFVYPLSAGLVCGLLLLLLLRSRLAGRIVDRPNQRSLHEHPVPRIGGLALLGGALPLAFAGGAPWQLLLLALFLLALSLIDDIFGLSVRLRLAGHLFAALFLVFSLDAAPVSFFSLAAGCFACLACAWMTNLYNFMDGSNGLAGGMAFFGFGALGLAAVAAGDAPLAVLGASLAVSALAFLRFNFHPARVFLGDCGAIPLGFLAAGIGLAGAQKGLWPWWFAPLVFAPFIIDATVTLLRRLLRGERVWQAHREHYYQRLIRMGWSHRRTALAYYCAMFFAAAGAFAARFAADAGADLAFVGILFLELAGFVWAMLAIDLAWRRRPQS
ncbi:MAG: hypothetical protein FWD77_10620 [Betaproteobacteria bacterium]|nr:hypothetical protein [Betaproteobacteria bacterium]